MYLFIYVFMYLLLIFEETDGHGSLLETDTVIHWGYFLEGGNLQARQRISQCIMHFLYMFCVKKNIML